MVGKKERLVAWLGGWLAGRLGGQLAGRIRGRLPVGLEGGWTVGSDDRPAQWTAGRHGGRALVGEAEGLQVGEADVTGAVTGPAVSEVDGLLLLLVLVSGHEKGVGRGW